MLKDTNTRFSGVTTKDIYSVIQSEANRLNITVSKYISMILEREVVRINNSKNNLKSQ